MTNTHAPSGTDSPEPSAVAPPARRERVAEWAFRLFLVPLVLGFGFVVSVIGPLLAISCSSCQDGVRNPLFAGALMALAHYIAPLTALGTAIGIFHPRKGLRIAAMGVGVLAVLFVLILVLGQIPA